LKRRSLFLCFIEISRFRRIILEIKAIEAIAPVHLAQILSYLKLGDKWLGFLLNFNVPVMKEGIRRV
jgi:GxxExxY protein